MASKENKKKPRARRSQVSRRRGESKRKPPQSRQMSEIKSVPRQRGKDQIPRGLGPIRAGDVSIRLKHTEYLAPVSSSVDFVNTSYAINPGDSFIFPWLSSMARNFEKYNFHSLRFRFVSTSADALNSVNTALGKLIMATEYDVTDPKWTSQRLMMGSPYSLAGRPSANMTHVVDMKHRHLPVNTYFVRGDVVPRDVDIHLYDTCNFEIASIGSQAVAVVGDLWVDYDVSLMNTSLEQSQGAYLGSNHWRMGNIGASNNLFANFTDVSTYPLCVYNVAGAILTVNFLPYATGNFVIYYGSNAGAATSTSNQVGPGIAYGAGVASFAGFNFASQPILSSVFNIGQNAFDDYQWCLTVTVNPESLPATRFIQFTSPGVISNNLNNADMYITRLNNLQVY